MTVDLDATNLKERKPSEESLNHLILKDDELQTIKALASRLTKTNVWNADYIEGKGAGGIVLLHGMPTHDSDLATLTVSEVPLESEKHILLVIIPETSSRRDYTADLHLQRPLQSIYTVHSYP